MGLTVTQEPVGGCRLGSKSGTPSKVWSRVLVFGQLLFRVTNPPPPLMLNSIFLREYLQFCNFCVSIYVIVNRSED